MLNGAKGKLAQIVLLTFILFTANGCDYFRNSKKSANCNNFCSGCECGYTKVKNGRNGSSKSKMNRGTRAPSMSYICSCCCCCCDYGCCVCCDEGACCCCELPVSPGGYPCSTSSSSSSCENVPITCGCYNCSDDCCTGLSRPNSSNCSYRSSPRSSYKRSSYRQRSCSNNCCENDNNNSYNCENGSNCNNTGGRYQ